jgi:hypothetical protein
MEELSTPAIALLTMLQDGYESDSVYLREHFLQEFPEADYDAILISLKNAGMYPEPASISWGNSRKVRFAFRSEIPMRFD